MTLNLSTLIILAILAAPAALLLAWLALSIPLIILYETTGVKVPHLHYD